MLARMETIDVRDQSSKFHLDSWAGDCEAVMIVRALFGVPAIHVPAKPFASLA
ncbi:hypothetical protein ACVWWI_001521 [Bradyrhizobium sp. USDA 3686]|nr:hypothetical protein [Bradyrhizobium canariense]